MFPRMTHVGSALQRGGAGWCCPVRLKTSEKTQHQPRRERRTRPPECISQEQQKAPQVSLVCQSHPFQARESRGNKGKPAG